MEVNNKAHYNKNSKNSTSIQNSKMNAKTEKQVAFR